jgi:hypothetical protein
MLPAPRGCACIALCTRQCQRHHNGRLHVDLRILRRLGRCPGRARSEVSRGPRRAGRPPVCRQLATKIGKCCCLLRTWEVIPIRRLIPDFCPRLSRGRPMELGAKVRQALPVCSVFDQQGLKTTAPHQPIALATTLRWHSSSSLQALMVLKTVRESGRGCQLSSTSVRGPNHCRPIRWSAVGRKTSGGQRTSRAIALRRTSVVHRGALAAKFFGVHSLFTVFS